MHLTPHGLVTHCPGTAGHACRSTCQIATQRLWTDTVSVQVPNKQHDQIDQINPHARGMYVRQCDAMVGGTNAMAAEGALHKRLGGVRLFGLLTRWKSSLSVAHILVIGPGSCCDRTPNVL
jgi:hypothetical protein